MNPAAVCFGIAALCVAIGVAYAALSRGPFLRPGDRVWLMGDSIGFGLLPKLIAVLEHDCAGAPIGGTNIQQWLGASKIQAAQQWGATVVLVVLGTNDAAASQGYRAQVGALASQLCASIQSAGMRIAWLGPGLVPQFASTSPAVQGDIANACRSMGALALDPTPLALHKADGVHPDGAGYATLASWVTQQLTQ